MRLLTLTNLPYLADGRNQPNETANENGEPMGMPLISVVPIAIGGMTTDAGMEIVRREYAAKRIARRKAMQTRYRDITNAVMHSPFYSAESLPNQTIARKRSRNVQTLTLNPETVTIKETANKRGRKEADYSAYVMPIGGYALAEADETFHNVAVTVNENGEKKKITVPRVTAETAEKTDAVSTSAFAAARNRIRYRLKKANGDNSAFTIAPMKYSDPETGETVERILVHRDADNVTANEPNGDGPTATAENENETDA